MAKVRYAVRRAKNRSERAGGKRWIAQAEFPGGRKILIGRGRNRAPMVQKIQQYVRAVVQQVVTKAGNGGAGGGRQNGSGGIEPIRLE